ncbi:SLBB domain-containing protein, partial [Roseivirga sp. E12]|uniref:SLBB domain-containing protein n=1 Tax=Roseivirga sp. E12 TaxID=2819237 RepID=UPI001ABC3729
YIRQAEERGLTQSQLEDLARQQGVSESEISKLRRRISSLRNGMVNSRIDPKGERGVNLSQVIPGEEGFDFFSRDNSSRLSEEGNKIFGLGLFKSERLTFTPNLNIPTPSNYILAPGDELIVDLWGDVQQYSTYRISPEGTIRLDDLSPVNVNGLTIDQAKKKIVNRLSQIYSALVPQNGEKQSIFHQISLGNIRTINITIVGEVDLPGNYSLNSLSTVFTALYSSGGTTEEGGLRNIKLMRNNVLKTQIDVYDFLLKGIRPNDELLNDGDVIVVDLYGSRVEVEGEIKRPGIYEMKEEETLGDLMEFVGGFTSNAYKPFIKLMRNDENGKSVINVDNSQFLTFKLKDGDRIEVRSGDNLFSNRVQIEGAVHLADAYELTQGLTVLELIKKSGGLKGDAFLNRASVHRMNPDFSQSVLTFDLKALLNKEIPDIDLQNEDIVSINSIHDLKEQFFVDVIGEVAYPGTYPFLKDMTVEDLILLSGGLTEGASSSLAEIVRRNKRTGISSLSEVINVSLNKGLGVSEVDDQAKLKPFDHVYIRTNPSYHVQQELKLEGEVVNPGVYGISRKDERISDIIKRANGLTPYAYPEGAILIRKNEFSSDEVDKGLDTRKLSELLEKLTTDSTLALNKARVDLIARVESKIAHENKRKGEDSIGVANKLQKELTESLSDRDSLSRVVKVGEQEATVLDLVEILKNPGSRYDYILRAGDVISVPTKLETVRIAGEVISPLNLRYDDQFSFKDYINDAGGFTVKAKKGRSYVQYPNGRRRQTRRFLFFKFYPKVEPGSTIFVSRKPDRVGINMQSIVAAAGSVATLALVIDRLSN